MLFFRKSILSDYNASELKKPLIRFTGCSFVTSQYVYNIIWNQIVFFISDTCERSYHFRPCACVFHAGAHVATECRVEGRLAHRPSQHVGEWVSVGVSTVPPAWTELLLGAQHPSVSSTTLHISEYPPPRTREKQIQRKVTFPLPPRNEKDVVFR